MGFSEYLAYVKSGEGCRDYHGQRAGRFTLDGCDSKGCANPSAPNFNRPGRTDVEGCCWWGRGVIQTTGVCNFGKLNYFLGARAQREGREALFPDIDFCKDPQAICSSKKYPNLKWIAGLFYWMNSVQSYDHPEWNYKKELASFVDGGFKDASLINAVSSIVNRGCHSNCPTGPVLESEQRLHNFVTVLNAMQLEV
jgi:hypothetical protein